MELEDAPPSNVQVSIRIRPLLEREKNDGHETSILDYKQGKEIS